MSENTVTINGEKRIFAPGTTLHGVLRTLELEPERVAIELNRTIVKRDRWDTVLVEAGSEIEIVQFVGGG